MLLAFLCTAKLDMHRFSYVHSAIPWVPHAACTESGTFTAQYIALLVAYTRQSAVVCGVLLVDGVMCCLSRMVHIDYCRRDSLQGSEACTNVSLSTNTNCLAVRDVMSDMRCKLTGDLNCGHPWLMLRYFASVCVCVLGQYIGSCELSSACGSVYN